MRGSDFNVQDGTKVGIVARLNGPASDLGEMNDGSFELEYVATHHQEEGTYTLLRIDCLDLF